MTRETVLRCVEVFDRLRVRVGAAAAMEQALGYARADAPGRIRIARDAEAFPDVIVASYLAAVARAYGTSVKALRERGRALAPLRDEVVHVVRELAGPEASYPVLGRMLGRDHSSLVNGQQRFEARLRANELLAARVERLIGATRAEARAAA